MVEIENPEKITWKEVKLAIKKIRYGLLSINWKKRGKQTDYNINKWLFYSFEILYYLVAFSTIFTNWEAFQGPYVYCPEHKAEFCLNPYYDEVFPGSCGKDYCMKEKLLPGESIGTPTNFLYPIGIFISVLLYIFPFWLNHKLYNKNKKFWLVKE